MRFLRNFTSGSLFILAALQVTSGQVSSHDSKVAAPGSGTISGRVTFEGRPLAGIQLVLISADDGHPRLRNVPDLRSVTDEDGKFRLSGVPAGIFTLAPVSGPYVAARDGYHGIAGNTIVLRTAEEINGIDLSLKRGGVISGRVTGLNGSPVVGQQIILESLEANETKRQIETNPPDDTDDRGIYRLYGLPTGRYLVSIRLSHDLASQQKNIGYYQSVYSPGVREKREANIVEIRKPADEICNVNIVLSATPDLYTATGRVIDSTTHQAVPNVQYGFTKIVDGTSNTGISPVSRTNGNGEFVITDLAQGQYILFAIPASDSGAYSDAVPFAVNDADVKDLEILLHQGSTVTGVVSVEGADPSTFLQIFSALWVVAGQSDDLGYTHTARAKVGQDGSFSISGLRPGTASLLARSEPPNNGLSVVRLEINGQEQPNAIQVPSEAVMSGVHLVVGYWNSTLRGEIQIQNPTIPEGMRFLIALTRPGVPRRMVRVTNSDSQNRFVMTNLPTGDFELRVYEMANNPSIAARFGPISKRVTLTSGINDVAIVVGLASGP